MVNDEHPIGYYKDCGKTKPFFRSKRTDIKPAVSVSSREDQRLTDDLTSELLSPIESHYLKKEIIEKISFPDLINKMSDANYVGRGEFSEVWLIDGIIIKRNAESSFYNPHIWSGEIGLSRSKKNMQGEWESYQILKDSSIMPKFLEKLEHQGRFYLIREGGKIPIAERQERMFLPKWIKGSVIQEKYDEFVEELYNIAQNYGYFFDIIQPALREDDSLFITDLGQFITEKETFIDDEIITENFKRKDDHWRITNYQEVRTRLDKLDQQIGLKHRTPDFVVDENVAYYQKEYEERSNNYSVRFADMTVSELLTYWKRKKRRV